MSKVGGIELALTAQDFQFATLAPSAQVCKATIEL
jgi:hypothetical protein